MSQDDRMIDHRHTGIRRSATGLDAGARLLILTVLRETAELADQQVVTALFRDRYGSVPDYLSAVEEVHSEGVAFELRREVDQAAAVAIYPVDFRRQRDPDAAAARALLLGMPEDDFRLAVEEALRAVMRMGLAAARITSICRDRGSPWRFDGTSGFQWVGDAIVARDLVEPALAAIDDPRFSGGVRSEFESARAELRRDTAESRKHAIQEAGSCVESAMKVVLDERAIPYGSGDAAQRLFDHLAEAGVIPSFLERLVLAPAAARNQTAAHGAGAVPHDPGSAEAESVVASAAGAIAYLRSLLK